MLAQSCRLAPPHAPGTHLMTSPGCANHGHSELGNHHKAPDTRIPLAGDRSTLKRAQMAEPLVHAAPFGGSDGPGIACITLTGNLLVSLPQPQPWPEIPYSLSDLTVAVPSAWLGACVCIPYHHTRSPPERSRCEPNQVASSTILIHPPAGVQPPRAGATAGGAAAALPWLPVLVWHLAGGSALVGWFQQVFARASRGTCLLMNLHMHLEDT